MQSAVTSSDSITFTHSYAKTGSYTPTVQVENFPNGPNANLYYPSSSSYYSLPSVKVQPLSMSASPTDYQEIYKSATLSLKYSAIAPVSSVTISINGVQAHSYSGISPYSGTLTYDYSSTSEQPLYVIWSLSQQDGFSQSLTMQYGSPLIPAFNSTSVTVLQGTNETHSYPITLSGVPSGSGYYQQLITITNPSQYGINKAGSNIQFTAQNGTLLYAWEQSINSSALQVWIKNYYGNSVIDMQVLPSFENLFSATGYLGYGREYFNAPYVFPDATDFSSQSGLSEVGASGWDTAEGDWVGVGCVIRCCNRKIR